MKIKISKSQWEGIGKKAGWMKKSNQELLTEAYSKIFIKGNEEYNSGLAQDLHNYALLILGKSNAFEGNEMDNLKGKIIAYEKLFNFMSNSDALNVFDNMKEVNRIQTVEELQAGARWALTQLRSIARNKNIDPHRGIQR